MLFQDNLQNFLSRRPCNRWILLVGLIIIVLGFSGVVIYGLVNMQGEEDDMIAEEGELFSKDDEIPPVLQGFASLYEVIGEYNYNYFRLTTQRFFESLNVPSASKVEFKEATMVVEETSVSFEIVNQRKTYQVVISRGETPAGYVSGNISEIYYYQGNKLLFSTETEKSDMSIEENNYQREDGDTDE